MPNYNRLTPSQDPDHDYQRLKRDENDRFIKPAQAQVSADIPLAGEGSLEAQRREVRLTAADLAKKVAGLEEILDIVMDPNRVFTHGEGWGDASLIDAVRQRIDRIGGDVDALIAYINDDQTKRS